MGFEVYFHFCGEAERVGIPREAVRSLFQIVEEESEPDYWALRYDSKNSCNIGVAPLESDTRMLNGLYVERPCQDLRLWEGLLSVLRMGTIAMFWPGGPAIIANEATTAELPEDMIESLGLPKVVHSVTEVLWLLKGHEAGRHTLGEQQTPAPCNAPPASCNL